MDLKTLRMKNHMLFKDGDISFLNESGDTEKR